MNIRLIRPETAHKAKALEFRQEFFDCGERVINGSELLDRTESYEAWLESVTKNTKAETVDPSWVVTDTFFALDESNRIVGIIDLRHTLNDFLRDFGNCGYSVRPTERRKGFATEMLRLLCAEAKAAGMAELHLSVERDNLPSVRTIVKNGGVLERSFTFEEQPADIYLITL
ncbi:MAG: GNAT family N-acetyltransferase [Oscillospiraceae bacterium]|nr:GNAT family N-acetyltransferase [Oscillospiraceae bacterium]